MPNSLELNVSPLRSCTPLPIIRSMSARDMEMK